MSDENFFGYDVEDARGYFHSIGQSEEAQMALIQFLLADGVFAFVYGSCLYQWGCMIFRRWSILNKLNFVSLFPIFTMVFDLVEGVNTGLLLAIGIEHPSFNDIARVGSITTLLKYVFLFAWAAVILITLADVGIATACRRVFGTGTKDGPVPLPATSKELRAREALNYKQS